MSGAEALGEVTLRPWPAPKKEGFSKQELLRQIEQLTAERGHLRDITEESSMQAKMFQTTLLQRPRQRRTTKTRRQRKSGFKLSIAPSRKLAAI
jgi:hypothetical protein